MTTATNLEDSGIESSSRATNNQETGATDVAPVSSQERIAAIDTLRGVAVLGILLMNIIVFGLGYDNPGIIGGSTGRNLAFWFTSQVLFEGKMRALFSMLFGAGVILFTVRAEARGGGLRVADLWYRRTLWLIAFGVLHAYFLWAGDILYAYGVLGLILFPLRHVNPKALLIAGLLLLTISTGKHVWSHHSDARLREQAQAAERAAAAGQKLSSEQQDAQKQWQERLKELKPDQQEIDRGIAARRGGYWKLFVRRASFVARFQSEYFYQEDVYDAGGMMLIGMALLKLGVLTGARSRRVYLWLLAVGYGCGGTINALTGWRYIKSGFDPVEGNLALFAGYDVGRLAVALGHIALVMLIINAGALKWLTSRLRAAGQMALSNYLATTVICTTLFYGYGFGLFARLQRFQLLYVVFGVWLFILVVSPLWLRHFRFGPMEWVWRSLTYWQPQPMRLNRTSDVPAPKPMSAATGAM